MAKLALQNAETLEMFIHRQIQASASGYGPSLSPQWSNAKHVQPFVGPLVIHFFSRTHIV
jgi:hypothetical protein